MDRPELDFEATVPALLRRSVARFGDHELVVTDTDRLTYRQADVVSRQLAKQLLAAGVGKGTRVGTHFPYGIEWVLSWLALDRIGALHVPFSTAYKPAELAKALRHADIELLIAPSELFGAAHAEFVLRAVPDLAAASPGRLRLPAVPYLREVWLEGSGPGVDWARRVSFGEDGVDTGITDDLLDAVEASVTPADLSVMIYTSGTTSEPKGVYHSHGALVRKGAHLAALMEWTGDDRVFTGMPFFWVGGIAMTVVPAVYVGATLLCLDRTEPLRSLDLMERERATVMTGWPGVRGPIEAHPTRPGRDIPALDVPALSFGTRHGSLGMTETLASYTFVTRDQQQSTPLPDGRTGSMGLAIDGAEIRVVDPVTREILPDDHEGAILVRGYFLMQGMNKRDREAVFEPDGFYDTGDKGYLLDGLLFLTGRTTEMIKTSGNNVAPPEVEAVLLGFPGVKAAHVLGVPDPERGEIVAALVVTDDDPFDTEALQAFARDQLSNYKVPRFVVVRSDDEMPWLATGKPDRLRVREILAEARAADRQVERTDMGTGGRHA
jgi:acyl-CoA synthetase (AMP-forming)/AMP-acid ligase II